MIVKINLLNFVDLLSKNGYIDNGLFRGSDKRPACEFLSEYFGIDIDGSDPSMSIWDAHVSVDDPPSPEDLLFLIRYL